MSQSRRHLSGWARLAPHFLAALSLGGMHALAQDIDVGFSGTIAPGALVNLVAPGGTVNGPVTNNGTLYFNNPDITSQTISAPITGTGAIFFFQPVTITLAGNNSFREGFTMYDGVTSVTGTLNGNGGLLELDGPAGTQMSVSGSVSNGVAYLGTSAGQVGNVALSAGSWSSSTLYAGFSGTSAVTITGGAMSTSGQAFFGYAAGGRGTLSITSGSFVPATTAFFGYLGTSGVTVNGGRLLAADDLYFGYQGTGTATLTSGTISTGGLLTVGKNSVGSLTVNGGSLTSNAAVIGQSVSGTGTVTMNASVWQVATSLEVGSTTGGVGNLLISGGGVTSATGLVGNLAGSTGRATITSGSWSITGAGGLNGNLQVGAFGTGTMTVSGGVVTADGASIGTNNAGKGTVIVNGGQLTIANLTNVGSFARGTLQVSSGTLTTGQVIVGASSQGANTGTGSVSVSGGVWNSSLSLTVGQFGNGTYTQTGGLVTAAAGYIGSSSSLSTTGTGSVLVTGGTLAYAGNVTVGNSQAGSTGSGTMAVGNGGYISVADTLTRATNGTINVNTSGTLSIGVGGTTGALAASVLDNGLVIFNRTTDYTYGNSLSGTGSVTKLGASMLTISGSNSYSGATSVITGTMKVNGMLGMTNLTVYGGALLSGTGSILGPVTISSNGTISPGASPGTLSTGDYTMIDATSLAQMQISGSTLGQYDQVAAAGTNSVTWGLGTVAVTMDTTPNYLEGTTFHLFSGFTIYTGSISGITLSAGGTDYSGLTFSDAGAGVWRTGRSATNDQYLEFNTTTGDLIVVPEPTTLAAASLCSLGLVLVLVRRTRYEV